MAGITTKEGSRETALLRSLEEREKQADEILAYLARSVFFSGEKYDVPMSALIFPEREEFGDKTWRTTYEMLI